MRTREIDLGRRLIERIEGRGECLLWAGAKSQGYGYIRVNGRSLRTHIAAYELVIGPVPPGKVLDHTCHNEDPTCPGGSECWHRACLNVDHLEPVTRGENIARSPHTVSIDDYHRSLTHCPQNHPYDEANTRITKRGARACRACARERARSAYQPRGA